MLRVLCTSATYKSTRRKKEKVMLRGKALSRCHGATNVTSPSLTAWKTLQFRLFADCHAHIWTLSHVRSLWNGRIEPGNQRPGCHLEHTAPETHSQDSVPQCSETVSYDAVAVNWMHTEDEGSAFTALHRCIYLNRYKMQIYSLVDWNMHSTVGIRVKWCGSTTSDTSTNCTNDQRNFAMLS